MPDKSISLIIIALFGLTFTVACGDRTLPNDDAARLDDGGTQPDRQAKKDRARKDTAPKKDLCKRPTGGCFSSSDCPPNTQCKGCGADPCCPMCGVCYGKCIPISKGCASNGDCGAPNEYCHIDNGCKVTGAKMGDCKPKPGACPEMYAPVCGCDGKTHGNSCVAHSKGINVAHTGPCKSPSCDTLAKQYMTLLNKAKVCCSTCGTAPQCTLKLQDKLACGCPTFVNPGNNAPVKQLKALQQEWKTRGCVQGACPPSTCASVSYGVCGGFGATAHCYDSPGK